MAATTYIVLLVLGMFDSAPAFFEFMYHQQSKASGGGSTPCTHEGHSYQHNEIFITPKATFKCIDGGTHAQHVSYCDQYRTQYLNFQIWADRTSGYICMNGAIMKFSIPDDPKFRKESSKYCPPHAETYIQQASWIQANYTCKCEGNVLRCYTDPLKCNDYGWLRDHGDKWITDILTCTCDRGIARCFEVQEPFNQPDQEE